VILSPGQPIVPAKQRCLAGSFRQFNLQNCFKRSGGRRITLAEVAVTDDQQATRLETSLEICRGARKIFEAQEMIAARDA
jgi:hypothetical protein